MVDKGDTVREKSQKQRPTAYATSDDFCRIFEDQMNSLYLLSLLLTADHQKAKQCFVAGLENAREGTPVFREWANCWARRSIMQNAIRLCSLPRSEKNGAWCAPVTDFRDGAFPSEQPQIIAILELPSLERFVFVMSVLEGYSNQECSLLLGCSRREVVGAQTRALQQIASGIQSSAAHPDHGRSSESGCERVFG